MSDDDRSDSSSDSEDVESTGLIATRQKRATAGNLYATLRANLDDEELQKELLAEDEEGDAGDYEGSEKGEEDDVLDSSSDEEDAGPPKEGEAEDLDGEKALKRQERVEAKKKRKAHEARLKLPAWQKKKRVKLADDVKTEDGNTSERPRKKSERSNWLPTPADAPVRQSGRSLAVANREIVHAHLKQSAVRSEKQRRVMKDAAEREKSKKRMEEMTQAERLKKCERIERETAREFGRWEREEAERQRLREEALAAKRRKVVDGPFMRFWSGSVLWEGERIKVRRMSHGSKKVEDVVKDDEREKENEKQKQKEGEDGHILDAYKKGEMEPGTGAADSAVNEERQRQEAEPVSAPVTAEPVQQHPSAPQPPVHEMPAQAPVPWLQGIQEYAAQPTVAPTPVASLDAAYTPSAPAINGTFTQQPHQLPPFTQPYYQPQPQPPPGHIYHGWPPGAHQFQLQPLQPPVTQSQPPPPPPPPAPLLREQARRSLVILSQFPSLTNPSSNHTTIKRTYKHRSHVNSTDPDPTATNDPLKSILLPHLITSPTLTPEESKYLTTRPRKRTNLNEHPLPPAPLKRKCAITSWPGKFKDPKTGLVYADMHQYKAIQRVLAGACAWSALLGGWTGPKYGSMGRPAKGVPEGFAGLSVVGGVKAEGES